MRSGLTPGSSAQACGEGPEAGVARRRDASCEAGGAGRGWKRVPTCASPRRPARPSSHLRGPLALVSPPRVVREARVCLAQ